MKKLIAGLAAGGAMFLSVSSVFAAQPTGKGFDEFGYNRTARNFVGTCLSWGMGKFGWTQDQAAAYCGAYSGDKLVMKWNAEWDRGNAEGWANGPYAAWENNEWNGAVPGGSGDVWHYKIKWVGTCGADGAPTADGGYCLWGQFEVLMDQGTSGGEHFWYTKAVPNGYGVTP